MHKAERALKLAELLQDSYIRILEITRSKALSDWEKVSAIQKEHVEIMAKMEAYYDQK